MARRQPHTGAKLGLATRCSGLARRYTRRYRRGCGEKWFRDLDSNQDTQLQRLMSYRLDDPGIAGGNCSRGMQACTGSANERVGEFEKPAQIERGGERGGASQESR